MTAAILTIMGAALLAAETPAELPDAGKMISVETVASLIVSILGGGALAGGGVFLGRKTRTTIDGQPLRVAMEKDFATRREFDQLRSDMARENAKLDGMMARVLDKMDERDKRLTERMEEMNAGLTANIERAAKGAGEGRIRIWDAVREIEKEVAAVAAVAGVKKPAQTRG